MLRKRSLVRLAAPALVLVVAALALIPAGASAAGWSAPGYNGGQGAGRSYGSTGLVLAPSAAAALESLGVTAGLVSPAYASNGAFQFPITTPPLAALGQGTIQHVGGITLSSAGTTVSLTNFWIELGPRTLSAQVNGGARVPILSLSFKGARLGFGGGQITLGPVTGSLTSTAAQALNQAFSVSAFNEGLVLGQATVQYRLFGGLH